MPTTTQSTPPIAAAPRAVNGQGDMMENASTGWEQWSPRAEIAPRFRVDAAAGRKGRGAIAIEIADGDSAAWGAWRRRVDGIVGGRVYRFVAFYKATGVAHPIRSVSAQLDWLDAKGRRVRPPDYAMPMGQEDGWTKLAHIAPAPPEAHSVVISLALGWAAGGAVRWDGIELKAEPAAPNRVVRAATIYARPQNTASAAASVEQFCRLIEQAAPQRPDIICLPEGITLIGTGLTCAEVSEPLHGPTAKRLGKLARQLNCYIVAGIYEREGQVIYNTAILLGRDGELAGSYRKTHLPREEVEAGLTPGDSYPVFKTDFGTIGIMICWDLQFPEACRALALAGAEMVLLPIWGGSEPLAYARAIENHLFLVSSSYDMKSFVLDPTGAVRAEATPKHPVAVAELHLDRKIIQPWLGDMKTRTWKERRPDITPELSNPGHAPLK